MSQEEYTELKASVDAVAVQDVHLGRVLSGLLFHLGTLSGVDMNPAPAPEAAPVESEASNAS